MKNIVVALGAKRAVACAGRGEKCESAVARSAAAAVALALMIGTASAQDATSYDSGGVRFSFPGWVVVDSVTRRGEQHRRIMTVQPNSDRNSTRRCILSGREDEAAKDRTQAELNAGLHEAVLSLPPDPGVRTLRREVIVIDGVAVFEEETFTPDRRFPLRSRTRQFAVAMNGRTMSYLFFCAAVNEAANGRADDMDAVMDSLHFTEQLQ